MNKRKMMAIALSAALVAVPAMAGKRTVAGSLDASAKINNAKAYGSLGVLMTETGLSKSQSYSYQLSATVTADYDCGEITQTEIATYAVNGVTSSRKTMVLSPPVACANGRLLSITYANIVLADWTTNRVVDLGDLSQ